MVRKLPPKKPDTSLLNEDEIEKVKAQARKEWEEEQRASQRRELLKAEKAELDREADPDEHIVEGVYIDLPPFSDRITLDGVVYLHGGTYSFPMRVYHTVRDIMARAWGHQQEIEGHKKDYHRPRGFTVSPEGVTTREALLRR